MATLSMPKRSIWVWAGALTLACATPRAASPGLLVARASFDLGCPPTGLEIHAFDARTRAVVGCGQRVTYVEDCRAPGKPCTWIADVGPTAVPTPPPAQPQPQATSAPATTAQRWPAATQTPVVPSADITAQPQPSSQGFRSEEDYGF